MAIHVKNEIGALRRVLVHRPGQELEHLTPEYLDQLLFDDIPYLAVAQQEHDFFVSMLRGNGIEVVYLEDLMAQTIAQDEALRTRFIREFIQASGHSAQHYQTELESILQAIEDPKELVLKTMAGVNIDELKNGSRGPLVKVLRKESRFVLDPIPNLYFTRDPAASVGSGVFVNRMYSKTRGRETIYTRFILEHHPDYAGKVPFYYRPDAPFYIEGGDIMNFSKKALGIGISQRTSAEAIELAAQTMFSHADCEIDTILAFDIPNLRAYMHLDTVFTQVDYNKFTIHPGILDTLRIYKITRTGSDGSFTAEETSDDLYEVLPRALGLDEITLIHCGGKDNIASAREQWNDGANTMCLSPGVIAVYNRNNITNKILQDKGVTIKEIPSSELSRGRGGPHCMTMPLVREDI